MPYSLNGSGGTISGEIAPASFKLQTSKPSQDIGPELVQILEFPHPCKVYVFNQEGEPIEIRFSEDDSQESAIIIMAGICWIETFSSVALFAKSNGQAKIRVTVFSNQALNLSGGNNLDITPLEIINGEPLTGFDVLNTPATFTLEARRENLGIVVEDTNVVVEIFLRRLYPETVIPVTIGVDSFYTNEWENLNQYFNDSLIWQTTVTISEPGRYFFGTYFNWAATDHLARLDIDLVNSKMTVLSEIQI